MSKGILKKILIFGATFIAVFVLPVLTQGMRGIGQWTYNENEESFYMPPNTEIVNAYIMNESGEKTEIENAQVETEMWALQVEETLVTEYDNGTMT